MNNLYKKMSKLNINKSNLLSLILILIIARLIPHPPNFTPIIAAAILSNIFFKNIYVGIFAIFSSMLIADLYLGFYNSIFYIYFAILLIIFLFKFIKISQMNLKNSLISGLIGSIIFFIISNFGVWLVSDMYSRDLTGLIECYFLAIPFFTNTFLSTVFYLLLFKYFNIFVINLNSKFFKKA